MFNRVRSLSFSSGELDSLIPDMDVEMLPTELRELYQSWSQSPDSLAKFSNSVSESDWPVSIYVPERYEERYAYPLVIWFHSDANDEDQLEQFMGAVSSQNYIGLALRGNTEHKSAGGYCWDPSSLLFGSVPLQDLLRGLIAFFDLPMSDFARGPADQPLLQAKGFAAQPHGPTGNQGDGLALAPLAAETGSQIGDHHCRWTAGAAP